ncbi:hypothetical protein PBAC_05390 [Pedobacter glucosidilyticus]|nr:T9SS type A sorting domain-containing protein [Pedobacter glucosidilyticus]KHJ39225.1 hypothetical protein PBAC_05390 [Pedobacter glucosidilyticus]
MNIKLLLFSTLLFLAVSSKAQNFITNWQNRADSYSGNGSTIGFASGIAYNPVTQKLYLAQRGLKISIIDPATGVAPTTGPDSLISTGIKRSSIVGTTTTTEYTFSKVAVTTDGEIYATTAAVNTTTASVFEIYYWINEAATPVKVYSYTITATTERMGDSFGLTGTGDNVILYTGGASASTTIRVLAKENGVFVKKRDITLNAAGIGGAAISAVTTGLTSDFWISGSAYGKRKYAADGIRLGTPANTALTATGPTANAISKNFIGLKYFEVGAKKFVAVNGGAIATTTTSSAYPGEDLSLHIYDVTGVTAEGATTANVSFVAGVAMSGVGVANTAAMAAVDFKRTNNADGTVTMQFFQVVSRNGFASHTITFAADGTLPVSLTSFTASLLNNQSQLNWSTASESNNAGFEIESSQDGISFNKIGFVASQATNSNSILNYSFIDKLTNPGTTYYRLKQVDLDGKFSYSEVKFITNQLSVTDGISVYPNPTEDFIILKGLDTTGSTITLFDIQGKQISRKGLVEGNKVVLKDLEAGVYILNVSKNGKLLHHTKVIKR